MLGGMLHFREWNGKVLTYRYRFLSLSTTSVTTGPVGFLKSSSVSRGSIVMSPRESGEVK